MSKITTNNLGTLLRSFEGIRNWRALLLLCGVSTANILVLFGGLMLLRHGDVLIFILVPVPLVLLLFLIGINGAGLLLIDQVDRNCYRSIGQAFLGGIGCALWVLLAWLLLAVTLLVLWGVLAALAFLSDIPGIGPFFAFILAGPSAVIFAFSFAFILLGLPLMFVAIWRGDDALGAIGRAVDIVVNRPLETFIYFLVLGLIVFFAASFAFAMLWDGIAITEAMHALVGLSSPVFEGARNSFGGPSGGGMDIFSYMASSIFVAGADGFSFGLVLLFLFTLIYLIWLTGSILVYDSLNIGVDATTAGRLRSGLQDFKRKIEENRLHSAPASQSTTAIHCPACGVPVTVDDLFCGRCGHRME